jgi:uncharacterized membrane protein
MVSHLTTDDASPRIAPRSARRGYARPTVRGRTSSRNERTINGGDTRGERLARALGWFSLCLGFAEVLAPDGLARLVGLESNDINRKLLRGMGLREIATGIGILSQPTSSTGVWSRVAGDAMDLAFLSSALRSDTAERGRVIAATAAVLGVTAVDVYCGTQLRRSANGDHANGAHDNRIEIKTAITIGRSPEELYRFWRDFENLPQFMHHLEAVRITGERTSHWKAKAPVGMTVEWDAEIIEDRPNELIVWQSLEGADVDNSGSVRFAPAPGNRGTEIILEMHFRPPAGVIGAKLAKLFDEVPKTQMLNDLRRFKQVIETGEVVHSDASITAGPNPARPTKHAAAIRSTT